MKSSLGKVVGGERAARYETADERFREIVSIFESAPPEIKEIILDGVTRLRESHGEDEGRFRQGVLALADFYRFLLGPVEGDAAERESLKATLGELSGELQSIAKKLEEKVN